MNHLVNGLTTISDLLVTSLLEVPPFQRAYAWDQVPQVRDLVDDLVAHPSALATPYFLGTILLTTTHGGDGGGGRFRQYAVVDGQQRLTTACVLAAVALQRLGNANGHDAELVATCEDLFVLSAIGGRRKFRTISEDESFFERFILGREEPREVDVTSPSQRRLRDAKSYLSMMLASRDDESIAALLRTLIHSQILVYAVNTQAEATQIFELQNDRGKRLTDLEALKSFLMHGLYVSGHEDVESDLNVVQQNFADIYRAAERIESHVEAPAGDDVLQYHCIAFEEWLTLEGDTKGWRRPKELVKKLVTDRRAGISAIDWIKQCSNRLRDSFTATLQILEARDTIEPMGDLTALGRVAHFWPLLLKCWRTDGTSDRADFARGVRAMERFAFRSSMAGKRSHTGESQLRRLARDFSGEFSNLVDELEKMRSWWGIEADYEQGLNSANFYDYGRLATYLLWRYENYLRCQRGQQWPGLSWKSFVSPATDAERLAKDHIEPKTENNPKLAARVAWSPDSVEDERRPFGEVFLHRLGNLVLDCISPGASKGSSDFATRVPHYTGRAAFLSQQELVTRFAKKNPDGSFDWDETSIRSRHQALVDFAKNHW